MLIPDIVLPGPALPRLILSELQFALTIASKIHHYTSIHARRPPASDRRCPRVSREVRPGAAHRITELLLLNGRVGEIVCREDDGNFSSMVRLLCRHWPAVVRQIGKAVVGERGVK